MICLNDGAMSEIVEEGVTGFVCNSPAQMAEVIEKGLDLELKPEDCRRRAELFSKENMAQKYHELYRELLHGREW